MDSLSDGTLAALAGLAGGIVLGLAARLGRFCTMGAIEDYLYGQDDRRLRMWALAIGVAIAGVFGLNGAGMLDLSRSIYYAQTWSPVASILGGLMFGYGMALAGNCGYGALARIGGGDLRAFIIILVMGISAYMAISGPTAYLRVLLFPVQPASGYQAGIAHVLGRASGTGPLIWALLIALVFVALALRGRRFRRDGRLVFWSVAVGLAVAGGWAATGWLATHGFDELRPVSHSFSAPVGESLVYLMTSSGSSLDFGVGSVAGVVIGAFVGCLFKGHFRWEACEDPRELRRQIIGAFLMGTGAVVALGCSVGQGITAFSVLHASAPVVALSIFAGAALGLRQLIAGFEALGS